MIYLETKRLIIRDFTPEDGEALYEYLKDPEVLRFEPYLPFSREAAELEADTRSKDPRFPAVCLKLDSGNRLIGNLYYAPAEYEMKEVGYVFHKAYWGQGYAREALGAWLDYAGTRDQVRKFTAHCDPLNVPSWKLLEAVGFEREGCLKQNVYFFRDKAGKPIWKDTFCYGYLRNEY